MQQTFRPVPKSEIGRCFHFSKEKDIEPLCIVSVRYLTKGERNISYSTSGLDPETVNEIVRETTKITHSYPINKEENLIQFAKDRKGTEFDLNGIMIPSFAFVKESETLRCYVRLVPIHGPGQRAFIYFYKK